MTAEVHTLRFGDALWLTECVPTLEAWAERHGYPVTVWSDPAAWESYPSPKFVQIDMLRAFLKGDADFMLYADADVFVRPGAPAFPFVEGFQMATDQMHREHNDLWHQWCQENYGEDFSKRDYCNAGVWSVSRKSAKKLLASMEAHEMLDAGGFQDQHWLNAAAWAAEAKGLPVLRLDSAWNRWTRDFEPSHFWHAWGDQKMRDLGDLKRIGLLDKEPDGLRYHFPAVGYPAQDKTIVLQFVKDCGLGNMMFEVAAGLGLSRRLHLPMMLNWCPTAKRDFELGHFGIGVLPFTEHPVISSKLGQGNKGIVNSSAQAIHGSKHRFPAVCHPFQAEECFTEVADEIREIFKLEPLLLGVPEGRTPVAVQVRRGDYVNHPRLDVVTPEYFINGMDFIRGKIAHPHFFFVSDDPAWCSRLFGHLPDTTVMPPQSSIDGLRTMVACDAHVISNSTFGWWGAWLGEKGPVVVPEIWHHRPGSYGNWKPAPDRWHRVSIGRPITQKIVESKPVPPIRFKELPKEYDRAIVIPWNAQEDKWHSLRFCLRSIYQHFDDRHCPIVILGTKRPGWLLLKSGRVSFEEVWSYQDALMRGLQIADEVLWMNDDILLLKPTGWQDFRRPLHFGEVTREFLADFEAEPNPWRDGFRATVAKLPAPVLNYSTHTPYLFERDRAVQILREHDVQHKSPFELAYFNTFAGAAGKQMNGERASGIPFGDAMFLNHTDHRLNDPLKSAIGARFPEYAPWELKSRFDILA